MLHFLLDGGVLKSQHSIFLQYKLNINVIEDNIKPIGADIFCMKNIVCGQEFVNPRIKEINKQVNDIRLKTDIQFNNCKIVNL